MVDKEEQPSDGKRGYGKAIYATVVVVLVVIVALLLLALATDDPLLDMFRGDGSYDTAGTVTVIIQRDTTSGDVELYADGVLVHTVFLEKGESYTYRQEVDRTVRWTAITKGGGWSDWDDAGPGSTITLTV